MFYMTEQQKIIAYWIYVFTFLGVVIFLTWLPTGGTRYVQRGDASVLIETSDRYFWSGCTNVSWQVDNVTQVQFDEGATLFQDQAQVCLRETGITIPNLSVTFQDGLLAQYRLPLTILPVSPYFILSFILFVWVGVQLIKRHKRIARYVLVICGLAALMSIMLFSPRGYSEFERANSNLTMTSEKNILLHVGQCTSVTWEAENIQAIYFGTDPTVGSRTTQYCQESFLDLPPQIRVVFSDGISQEFYLPVISVWFSPTHQIFFIAIIVFLYSAVVSSSFSQRLSRFVSNYINSIEKSPLTVFSFLWALGMLIHMISRPSKADDPVSFALIIAATLLALRPDRLFLLGIVSTLQIWEIWRLLPEQSNHWYLATFINLTILIVLARTLFNIRAVDRSYIWDRLVPVVQSLGLILYFFVVFHKLNEDHFNPLISCSAVLYQDLVSLYPALPQTAFIDLFVTYGGIGIELIIFVLLLLRRTRIIGVLIAMLFHGILGIMGFYNFSAILFAIFVVYLPDHFWKSLYEANRPIFDFLRNHIWLIVCAVFWLLVLSLRGLLDIHDEIFGLSWGIGATGLIVLVIRTIWHSRSEIWSPAKIRPFPIYAGIIPLLMILNAMGPYLGYKTENALEMYSNLHADNGGTNHLIVPASSRVFGMSDEIYTIQPPSSVSSSFQITGHELRRQLLDGLYRDDDYVILDNQTGAIVNVDNWQSVLGTPHPLSLRLLIFDLIDEEGEQGICTH